MPTYSYACTQCDNRFDAVQSFTDDALTTCEVCNGKLRKVYNSVGVVFKGSGFYHNDSRSSGTRSGAAKSAESKPASKPTESKPTVSKPTASKPTASKPADSTPKS